MHRSLLILFLGGLVGFNIQAVSQEPVDKEIKPVSPEIRTRIEAYFTLFKNEDWDKLYEIDDWPIRNKEDYVNIHRNEKTNPYRKFRSILEIGLEDEMHYWSSSKKWEVYGCTRLVDKDGSELYAKGSLYLTSDESRGWIIGDSSVSWFGDGFHKCEKPLSQLPIKINVSK